MIRSSNDSAEWEDENETGAPDSSRYGRERPEAEAGMGRLDNNDDAVPENRSDSMEKAVGNRQRTSQQVNAEDVEDERECGEAGRGGGDPEAGSPNRAKTPRYVYKKPWENKGT